MRAFFRRLLAASAGRLERKVDKSRAASVAAKVVTYAMTAAGVAVLVFGTGDPLLSPLLGIGFIGTGTLALTMMWRTKGATTGIHERFDSIDNKLDEVVGAVNQNTEAIGGKLDKVIELLGRGMDDRP